MARPLYLQQFEVGLMQNFVYLIGDPSTREALIVDPGWEVDRILKQLVQDDYKPSKLFLTHSHFDHINGVEEIVRATDAQVFVHKKEETAIPIEKTNRKITEGGAEIPLGPLKLTILHTPGHTPGSQCITIGDRLITGDTLFIGGCGRCDLPGGDAELMYKSLTRLRGMDERFVIHPGHNYAPQPTALLQDEKTYNPFLQAKDLDGFLVLVGAARGQA